MLTRMLRAVLSAVNQLDRGWGVLATRVVTAMRRDTHYRRTTISRALHRAVEEGYLRLNPSTGRYFSRGVTRAQLYRNSSQDDINFHILINNEEPVLSVFQPELIVMAPVSDMQAIPRQTIPGERIPRLNRNRELVQDRIRREAIPPHTTGAETPIAQRRQRFGQSLCLNLKNLSNKIKSLERLLKEQPSETVDNNVQSAKQL
uniref:Uncharacterized protein n=1 Tax=Homalodisca liturata TaxID=320908 RepID=A0A1B6I807_9HEMI